MTEEMVGGQHRSDEATQKPSVKGEHKRKDRNCRSQEFTYECARRRPTRKKKALATADLALEMRTNQDFLVS
jgi:hypothetical protein